MARIRHGGVPAEGGQPARHRRLRQPLCRPDARRERFCLDRCSLRQSWPPAFPGQRGFVGGSMGDDAVIVEGGESEEAKASLYSTIHGAGRLFGRREAKRRFTRAEMDGWLQSRGVTLIGADLDESPMAYRRLPEVLAEHSGSVKVLHTLRPFAVAMAGENEFDPFKD